MTTSVVQEVCDYLRHTIPDLSNEALLELVFAAAKGRGTPIDLQGLFEHVRSQSQALQQLAVADDEPLSVRPPPAPIEINSEPLRITFPEPAAPQAPIAQPVEEVARSSSRPTRVGRRAATSEMVAIRLEQVLAEIERKGPIGTTALVKALQRRRASVLEDVHQLRSAGAITMVEGHWVKTPTAKLSSNLAAQFFRRIPEILATGPQTTRAICRELEAEAESDQVTRILVKLEDLGTIEKDADCHPVIWRLKSP